VVYLDYNATTPVDPRVVEVMLPYLHTHFGNPSSTHFYGAAPRVAMARARGQVAGLIGAAPEEITFTGSGSEADAMAIRGVVLAAIDAGVGHPQVITQTTEHPAVLAACRYLADHHGAQITYLPVDGHGLVDPDLLRTALTPRTVLVTVMHANNETGALQPLPELAAITHEHGALFHTDAAQTVGKIPVDVAALGADLLTVVGHKMYAPKGIAALYVRGGVHLQPLIGGGGQERGLRAGTENVPYAVALGAAADLAAEDLAAGTPTRLTALRDQLHRTIAEHLPARVHLNGHPLDRLPHTLNVSIDGVVATDVLTSCPTLAASTGSACHAGANQPSPVLMAMGRSEHAALGSFRLSLGRWTTSSDIEQAAQALNQAVRSLPANGEPLQ
jgi:cysteine desulfurase